MNTHTQTDGRTDKRELNLTRVALTRAHLLSGRTGSHNKLNKMSGFTSLLRITNRRSIYVPASRSLTARLSSAFMQVIPMFSYDVKLINKDLAQQLGIYRIPLTKAFSASAPNGHLITHLNKPIHLLLSRNYHKTI